VYRISGYEIKNLDLGPIAKGGMLNFVGLLVATISAFIFQFILGRALSPGEVGIFNLGLTISSLVGLVMLVGLDRGVVRFIAHYLSVNDRERELGTVTSSFRILLLIMAIITPIAWFLSDDLANIIFQKPELTPVLRVFTLTLPFIAFTRWSMGVFLGYKRVKPIVFIEQIMAPVLRIVGALLIIITISKTAASISFSYLFSAIIGFCFSAAAIWLYMNTRKGVYRPASVYRELLLFSWPLLFAGLLNRTNTYTETLVLGGFSSSEQVGLYTICLKISIILTIFFEALNGIWAPFITEMFARSDMNKLANQFKTATYWAFSLTLPFALLMFLEAPTVLAIFGPEYVPGASILRILVISQVIYVVGGMSALVLIMTGYSQLNLIDLVLTVILSLFLDFMIIPSYGAIGAAIASTLAIGFVTVLRSTQVYVKIHIHPYHKDFLKPSLAGLLSFMIAIGLRPIFTHSFYIFQLIIVGSIIMFVYGLTFVVVQKYSILRI
jgi:O-antigen/teichoic acid export membrane protein